MVLFHADPDSEEWQCYLEYLDDMVVEGLFSYISRSLHFLVENMEAGLNQTPLFEAKLILNGSKMTFCPSMEKDAGDSLYELIEGLVADVFKTSMNIRRVAAHLSMETYQVRFFYVWISTGFLYTWQKLGDVFSAFTAKVTLLELHNLNDLLVIICHCTFICAKMFPDYIVNMFLLERRVQPPCQKENSGRLCCCVISEVLLHPGCYQSQSNFTMSYLHIAKFKICEKWKHVFPWCTKLAKLIAVFSSTNGSYSWCFVWCNITLTGCNGWHARLAGPETGNNGASGERPEESNKLPDKVWLLYSSVARWQGRVSQAVSPVWTCTHIRWDGSLYRRCTPWQSSYNQ